MRDEDVIHPNKSLQAKLEHIYTLRRGERMSKEIRGAYLNLLRAFGDPHLHLPPVIHVAGTNGKGSVCAILRALLEAAGHKVHMYSSPHLVKFNERIYLGDLPPDPDSPKMYYGLPETRKGGDIGDKELETLLDEALELNAGQDITFFELTTAMAFAAFARHKADIVLLETGMGGRIDCTNVVPAPAATVIMQIARDHWQYLGDGLDLIAGEKAGIMKPAAPCIIGYQTEKAINAGALDVFERRGAKTGAPLFIAGRDWNVVPVDETEQEFIYDSRTYPAPNLIGLHQIQNAGAALTVLERLKHILPVSDAQAAEGLGRIHWPGRLQKITQGPLFDSLPPGSTLWFDGGHNDGAAEVLRREIDRAGFGHVELIVKMKEDKDLVTYRNILKKNNKNVKYKENLPYKCNLYVYAGSLYNF